MKCRNEPIGTQIRKFSHAMSSIRRIHGWTCEFTENFGEFVVTYELTVLCRQYLSGVAFSLDLEHRT